MLTANPQQLWGCLGDNYWGLLLQAHIVHSIKTYQERMLVISDRSTNQEIVLLEKALKVLGKDNSGTLGYTAWASLLVALGRKDRQMNREKIIALWEQGYPRYKPALDAFNRKRIGEVLRAIGYQVGK
jgi:hypothetical protein